MASGRSPRRGRLSRSADFDRVLRNGRSHAGRDLVLYVFPRGGDEPPRLGLSVSRKVGGAVERNSVKRAVREAFACEAWRLPAGADVVVIARPGARDLAEREGMNGIRVALGELIGKVPGAATSGDAGAVTTGDADAEGVGDGAVGASGTAGAVAPSVATGGDGAASKVDADAEAVEERT